MKALPASLKEGDIVNVVSFSTDATVLLEGANFDSENYLEVVNKLETIASTNLDEGIRVAYQVANRTYDPEKSNRVVILTDAYANTGEVDSTVIA
jgi:Ca-activated chloride channel homolog